MAIRKKLWTNKESTRKSQKGHSTETWDEQK